MKKIIVLIVVFLLVLPALAITSGLVIHDMQVIDQVVTDIGFRSPLALSPDGETLAWFDRQRHAVCFFTFETEDSTCNQLTDAFRRSPRVLVWSPDSTYVAFTEDAFYAMDEPDIWVMHTATGEATNLTDDGTQESIVSVAEETPVDTMPIWNPVTGDLYFWRATLDVDDSAELYRMRVPDGQPQLVADLTGALPVLAVHEGVMFYFDGAQSFSPDGKTLAFLARGADLEDSRNGIWLLDVESGEPSYLTDFAGITGGLPDWVVAESRTRMPYGLSWTDDGSSLVTVVMDPLYSTETPLIPYRIDINTAESTALIDFSHVADKREMFTIPDDGGLAPSALWARHAILAPDGKSILAILSGFGQSAIVELSFDGKLTILMESEDPLAAIFPTDYSTRSRTDKVTIGGHLLTVTRD